MGAEESESVHFGLLFFVGFSKEHEPISGDGDIEVDEGNPLSNGSLLLKGGAG